MTPHTKLRKEIVAWLESQGAWVHTAHMGGYGRKGIPDLLVCWRGRFLAIEVKVGHKGAQGNPTTWQQRELDAVAKAQGEVVVARNIMDVVEHLFGKQQ